MRATLVSLLKLTAWGLSWTLLGCSDNQELYAARFSGPIELAGQGHVYELAGSLLDLYGGTVREREVASRASGALFAPLRDGTGPRLASNGVRLRASCGVVFVTPSYAVTAAHCVDATDTDLNALQVEMYRPTRAFDAAAVRVAAELGGTFPDFQHARLNEAGGYVTDRYGCELVARCSQDFGGPVNCASSTSTPGDVALLRCVGSPGARYGFVDLAEEDLPEAEVFAAWKHEIYTVPNDASDPRYRHYTEYSGDLADNYHYFGADPQGLEQNQLVPLVSADFSDGQPHHKLGGDDSVETDILGCHGTSGAPALQPTSSGRLQLLGPFVQGNDELARYLCNHVPALDGSPRGPLTAGLGYQSLAPTRALFAAAKNTLANDCPTFPSDTPSLLTSWNCIRDQLVANVETRAFGQRLFAPSQRSKLEALDALALRVKAGENVRFPAKALQAGVGYRLGLNVASTDGCLAAPCQKLTLRLGDRVLFDAVFDQAVATLLPFATTFVADATGPADVRILATTGAPLEASAFTLRPELTLQTFDTVYERAEAVLFDLDRDPNRAQPMRFIGDGKSGFAAALGSRERLVLLRQALAPNQTWSLRFQVTTPGVLRCGLLDHEAKIVTAQDCSLGFARFTDTQNSGRTLAAAYIERVSGEDFAEIDDLRLFSGAVADQDGDGIPDEEDECPRGPLPVAGNLRFEPQDDAVVTSCLPSPSVVTLAAPRVLGACEPGTLLGSVVEFDGVALEDSVLPVVDGRVTLPPGSYRVNWQLRDAAGNVSLEQARAVTVQQAADTSCCERNARVVRTAEGGEARLLDDDARHCVLGGAGDDFVTADASDSVYAGEGSNYVYGGGLLVGGAGADVLRASPGSQPRLFGGDGADTLDATLAAGAELVAGGGADVLLGSPFADNISLGQGTRRVLAGAGNDVVTLLAACEPAVGALIDGGDGVDTLVSSEPLAQLVARGFTVIGFESVRVDATRAQLAPCFLKELP